jgi:hypothetical protein
MAYGLQAEQGGAWWDTLSTFDQPVYNETVTRDIAVQSQEVQTTPVNNSWSDLFSKSISQVFDYAIKRDAVLTGAQVQKTMQTQPVYQPANYPVGNIRQTPSQILPGISNTMLLIGAAVGFYLVNK